MLKRGGHVAPSVRRVLGILPVWVACLAWMWSWWLKSNRVNFLPLFIPLSLALFYEFTLLPSVFLYFVLRAKKPPRRKLLTGQKVAVISLCVPAKESIDIIERQLKAMAEIEYPHDSWILDEGNSSEVRLLARKYGVKHFSRKGVSKYNQAVPPFKAKTKAGNVNAWLDHVKRRKYDFFIQLDIDHLPQPNYLHKTLGYFRDPQVAWVQAPSVYGNRHNWIARGAAEQELVLQGPMQMGFYGHSQTPFIIGSHCTYRTKAIREIGGFQPTRAEDHLDTLVLASHGYKGVFLPEIIAWGDGPLTLSTYLAQQFAWAYSMFQVLTKHTPGQLKNLPFKKKTQFLFAQTWYPLWTLSYLIMFLAPVAALLMGRDIAHLNGGQDFAAHFLPLFGATFLVWWSARPLMQPQGLGLSWRGMLLHVVRWPIVLRAVISSAFQIKKPYMITPKGRHARDVPRLATYRPFLMFGAISSLAVMAASFFHDGSSLAGQVIFALINAVFMLSICLVDINLRLRQASINFAKFRKLWLRPVMATMALMITIGGAILTSPLFVNQLVSANYSSNPPVVNTSPLVIKGKPTTKQLIQLISSLPTQPNKPASGLGIYNPYQRLNSTDPYIQHTFINWQDSHYLAGQILQAEYAGNIPLVTIEPREHMPGDKLLKAIADGQEDKRLSKVTAVLAASNRLVYVRFAHEMELVKVYPWGNQNPALYVKAYRHVVDYVRKHGGQNVRWVWSPAGNHGAEYYYPGNDVVDVVGTTILYDRFWYGSYLPSFFDLASQRQWLEQYGKPVWIVEFGAGHADTTYQRQLIKQAISQYHSLGFSALVYLNMVDANLRGPDYRLTSYVAFGNLFSPPPVKLHPWPRCRPKNQISQLLNTKSQLLYVSKASFCRP